MEEKILFDRYRILRKLGEGSQSDVFLVSDQQNHDILKAAKLLKPNATQANSHLPLVQEFQILESLHHPHLVQVFDCRFLPDTVTPVLVTEYVENTSNLKTLLGRLSSADKLHVLFQSIEALRYLHFKRIIHGDLKPSNILAFRTGNAGENSLNIKLIDFGVSHDLYSQEKIKRAGTPFYLAPEVLQGSATLASDLYSLGVVLYQVFISAKLPYAHYDFESIAAAHLEGRNLFPAADFDSDTVPASITAFIRQCLSRDPFERPRDLEKALKNFRFEFRHHAGDSSIYGIDSHSRRLIGMRSQMETLKTFVRKSLASTPDNASSTPTRLLFLCGPSGGGKTRFLGETSHFLQRDKIQHHTLFYRNQFFLELLVKQLAAAHPSSETIQKHRIRLQKATTITQDRSRLAVYSRFLHDLSRELGGLVLMIDGLPETPPSVVLEFLKLLASHRSASKTHSCLFLLVTVNTVVRSATRTGGGQGDEFNDLAANLVSTESGAVEGLVWREIPNALKDLKLQGLAKFIVLPRWDEPDVLNYLTDVFPNHDLGGANIRHITEATLGNPGVLHSIVHTALQCAEKGGNARASVLEQLDYLHHRKHLADHKIYKLKGYTGKEKAVLSFLGALGESSIDKMETAFNFVFDQEDAIEIKQTLIKAFDDRLIEVRSKDNEPPTYALACENVLNYLRELNRQSGEYPGYLLHQFMNSPVVPLSVEEKLRISRFLYQVLPWATHLAHLLDQKPMSIDRLNLAPFVEEIDEEMTSSGKMGVDPDTHLKIEIAMLEIQTLKRKFDAALERGDRLIKKLLLRTDRVARLFLAKTYLLYGTLLCTQKQFVEAGHYLRLAIDSRLLTSGDAAYADATLALCQLSAAPNDPFGVAELLERLDRARKQIKAIDPVRYALVVHNLAGFYLQRAEYKKALRYYQVASTIFQKKGEVTRYLYTQRRIGRIHYLARHYTQAISIFEEILGLAENLHLEEESCEILVYLVRCHFMAGHQQQFLKTWFRLNSLCAQIGTVRPITMLRELAVHTYLDLGQPQKAQRLVRAHMDDLKNLDPNISEAEELTDQLLLLKISMITGDWQKAWEQALPIAARLEAGDPLPEALKWTFRYYENVLIERSRGAREAQAHFQQHLSGSNAGSYFETLFHFRKFSLAVDLRQRAEVNKSLLQCLAAVKSVSLQEQLDFYADLARFHLSQINLKKAQEALRKGAALLGSVANQTVHAKFQDQQCHYAILKRDNLAAKRAYEKADKAYLQSIKNWDVADRIRFRESSREWKNHLTLKPHGAEMTDETNAR